MAGERTIKIKFAGDTTGLDKAAKGAETSMGKWSAKTAAFGAAAGIAIAKAGQQLFQFAKDSVRAFAESEEAQLKLNDAFTRFPNIADTNIATLQALNTELAKKTKFDDDATASGQATLAQFGLTGKQLEQLTPLLQDFAAKTGQDLPSAAGQLGKALLGQGRALKQVGLDFHDAGSVGANFDQIMGGLTEKVGGFAEKQGKTAAGQAAILDNQFGELQETLGGKLLPVMLKLTDAGLKAVDWLSKNKEIMIPLISVIGAVVVAQWAWNIAMTANPIGLIIVGVAALIAGIVFLATKTTFFQDIWRAVSGFVMRSIDNWVALFKALPDLVFGVFRSVANFITAPFRAAFNFIADGWNNTIGRLSWTIPSWVPLIGGNTISAPKLPKLQAFHAGGIVPGPFGTEVPILARAGERVLTAEQDREPPILFAELDLGEGIRQVVEIKLKRHDRALARAATAGAGAR